MSEGDATGAWLVGTISGILVVWAVSYEVGTGELVGALIGALRAARRRPAPPTLDVLRMLVLHTRSAVLGADPSALDCARAAGVDAVGHASGAARLLSLQDFPATVVPRSAVAGMLSRLAEAATWLDVAEAHERGEDGAEVAARAGKRHRAEVMACWNQLALGDYGAEVAADLATWGAADLLGAEVVRAPGPLERDLLAEVERGAALEAFGPCLARGPRGLRCRLVLGHEEPHNAVADDDEEGQPPKPCDICGAPAGVNCVSPKACAEARKLGVELDAGAEPVRRRCLARALGAKPCQQDEAHRGPCDGRGGAAC